VLSAIKPVEVGSGTGMWWEQVEFPASLNGAVALNLCNLGPAWPRRSATMIHDLQVYTAPRSSSLAFQLRYKTLFYFIGRRHSQILTVSGFSRDEIVAHGVAEASRITVVYNGVDHISRVAPERTVVTRLGLRPRGYVLALSNTKPHKNIPLLFEAFRDPRLADIQLVLFGSSAREDFLAQGASVPASAVFAGRVTDGELRGLMEGALCVAMPSTTEGFGLPPFEAMHLGIPAVVSSIASLREIAAGAAMVVDPSDAKAWSESFVRISADPALADQLAIRGRERAATLTWEASARRVLDVCERAAMA
jgi:glycosyltransferase involved in cell wall biosynthesis